MSFYSRAMRFAGTALVVISAVGLWDFLETPPSTPTLSATIGAGSSLAGVCNTAAPPRAFAGADGASVLRQLCAPGRGFGAQR